MCGGSLRVLDVGLLLGLLFSTPNEEAVDGGRVGLWWPGGLTTDAEYRFVFDDGAGRLKAGVDVVDGPLSVVGLVASHGCSSGRVWVAPRFVLALYVELSDDEEKC